MADAGENRPITRQVNAKEAETFRESKLMVCGEKSTEKVRDVVFADGKREARRRARAAKHTTAAPKTPKS